MSEEGVTIEELEYWFNTNFVVGQVEREDEFKEQIYAPYTTLGRSFVDKFYADSQSDRVLACDHCYGDIYKHPFEKTEEELDDRFCIKFSKNTFRIAYLDKENWRDIALLLISAAGISSLQQTEL